ncbi:MAG: glycosyltransferase family 39 protein [Fimbriimonadaceae bacterium]
MPASSSQQILSDHKRLILPTVLFIVAVLIRLPGLTWGLKDSQHNQSLHPDEELNFRVSRLIEPARLSFTPGFYSYGTLYLTAMRVAGDVAFAYSGGSDHPEMDWDYIRKGELAGRVVSLISGSLLCVVMFFAARRITSDAGAAAAAASLAVAPALVVHSRFATVDVFATLFVALAALYALRLLVDADPPWMRCAVLAGICAGLSAGTKYTGGLALLMPLAAIGLRRPPRGVALAGAATLAAALAFVVSTPGCVLDSARFMHDFTYEMGHAASGHGMVFTGTSIGYAYHLSNLFLGLGLILTLLGLGALVWASVRRQQWVWVLLAFSIPYYLVIGHAEVKFMRYVFPVTIGLAAGVGYAVGEGQRLGKGYRALVALGILGLGGIDAGGLRGAWFFTSAMIGPDHRELVKPNLKTQGWPAPGEAPTGPLDVNVGLVSDPWFWSPTIYPDVTMARFIPAAIRKARLDSSSHPHAVVYAPSDGSQSEPYDPGLIAAGRGPEYIAYSDFEVMYVDRVSKMPHVPANFLVDVARYKAFMAALQRYYRLDVQYGNVGDMVEDMRYVMPTVYVWIRKA